MKKTALVLALLLIALCTGCNGVIPQATPVSVNELQPKVTLRFINSWGGSDSKAGPLNDIFNSFMDANPDIEIVNESLFGDDFLIKLKTDFATGNDPDVFGLWPGSDIMSLVQADKVADLTDILNADPAWKQSFEDAMWYHTTFNDRIYGLPVELIFEGLFVNIDLFERFNVKVPTNFEELKEAVRVFRAHRIIPIAFNCKSEGTYIYQNAAMMMADDNAIENPIADGKINHCYIDAMYLMQELYKLDAFPDDLFTMTSVERNNLFINKKAAMIVQGSWFVSNFSQDMNVDIVPFPELSKSSENYPRMIYGLGCGTFYMSKRASDNPAKQEASIRLLRALTSKDTATLLAEKTGMMSNVKIFDFDIDYNRLTRKGMAIMSVAKKLVGPPDSYLPRSIWESTIVQNFPYMLEGKLSPEELWDMAMTQLK